MAQGATSSAPTPATPPAAPIGAYSPRSGSSFFDRFNRRPRTANSSHNRNISSNNPTSGMPNAVSTDSLSGSSGGSVIAPRAQHHHQQQQQQYLPRSSSSSNISQNLSFPRDLHASPPATPPAVNVHRNPMNNAQPASSPAQSSSGAAGSSGAFGRMFRRYSHGAGKNSSQDVALALNASGSRNGVSGSSNAGGPGTSSTHSPPPGTSSPSAGGRPSALRSLSNHFLPSSSSLSSRAIPDAITRTMSNQLAAVSGGMSTAAAPRSSVEIYSAASSRPIVHPGNTSSAPPPPPASTEPAQAASANSAHADTSSGAPHLPNQDTSTSTSGPAGPSTTTASTGPNTTQGYRIRLVPHLEASRSLHFEPIERELRDGATPVKIGRFTERGGGGGGANGAASGAASAVGTTVATAPARDGLTTASGPGTGSGGGGATLSSNARSAGIDVEMAGGGSGASSGPAGSESIPSVLASGRRQPAERVRGNNNLDSSRIAFKSKVVSRGHAEIWCENGGNFFLRDTKSSSGTFLNHIRLSAPGAESRPFRIKDGDVIQLGVDYQGGTEEIYRCVKMRIELNRGWQREANQYNVNALRQLRALQGSPMPVTPSGNETDKALTAEAAQGAQGATVSSVQQPPTSVTDCCICLFSVTVCQALFIAPCSHVFHYKCIRPLLTQHHPGFSCPLCRTFADLEADVEEEDEEWQADLMRQATQGVEVPAAATSTSVTPAPAAEPMSTQPTLAPAQGTTSVAPPLATVPEIHSRQSSVGGPLASTGGAGLQATNGDSAMLLDQAQGSSYDSSRQVGANNDDDGDQEEVLQDDDDDDVDMMEDFDEQNGRSSGAGDEAHGDSSSSSSDPSSQSASFANSNAANSLSLSASGSLAARRSLHNANFAPGSAGYGEMNGGVSEPISMAVPATANSAAVSSGLEEARTPMNQHFLSTLAESSPGGPAFFSAAAARVAAAAAAGRNGLTSVAHPDVNGRSTSSLADEAGGGDTPTTGAAAAKRGTNVDALGGRRSSSSGVGPAGAGSADEVEVAASSGVHDEVMSD
ncbi:hypothetical protein CF327_g2302 [Tilletia walkeri]|uniref:RING-type E3 ubiquitin transferase n=1 Tax=Tilletia walkeri TaxID=117179 RepID=A0A8X7T719_9BASI|nr:hypothetical protein CF327_g2302 [Tilletia walkeri]KAE8270869.1 hypothetical protein A4X09_0g1458 [Tilletia walkeri]